MARLNKSQKRKLSVFVKCLVFSFVAWALFAVSNNYSFSIRAILHYTNAPQNRAVVPLQSDTVNVMVEASGWQLLMASFSPDLKDLHVDLNGLRNRNWVNFTTQLGLINRQFPANQRVISVSPDTLYFDFSKQTERKVPVKALYKLNLGSQYAMVDKVVVNPEYVTITGPLDDVVQIEHWETDTIRIGDVKSPITKTVNLVKNQRANLNVFPTVVTVDFPVGEVTEKIVEVPIKAENLSKYRGVTILPGKVKLTVMVSLQDYAKISSSSFEAIVNMDHWTDHQIKKLPVVITQIPEYSRLVKVEPQNIDFFVRN